MAPDRARPVLLLGASGLLGRAVHQRLLAGGRAVHAPTRGALDLLRLHAIAPAVAQWTRGCAIAAQPGWVVNCAGFTDVDGAEAAPDLAHALNAHAVAELAAACDRLGLRLVHFSTDFVFDGTQTRPYVKADPPRPLSVYGASKLAGERAVLAARGPHWVLRVSWLHGPGGRNFFSRVGQWLQQDGELRVVADQWSVPHPVDWVAERLARLMDRVEAAANPGAGAGGEAGGEAGGSIAAGIAPGLYHLSSGQAMSRYDFARREAERLGPRARARLVPVPATAFPTAAARPRYSVLDGGRFFAAIDDKNAL